MAESSPEFFTDIDSWLEFQGFKPNHYPFDEVVAEKETHLNEYFIEFPYFSEIVKPRTTFLFLGRGHGKSANKVMLERRCNDTLKRRQPASLAVNYTDFYFLMEKSTITLRDHADLMLRQAVPRLFDLLADDEQRAELVTQLSDSDIEDMVWYLERYSNSLHIASLEAKIARVGLKQGWSTEQTHAAINKASKLALGAVGLAASTAIPGSSLFLEAIDSLLELKNKKEGIDQTAFTTNRYHSPADLLSRFAQIVQQLNIEHLYILVDRVDEFAPVNDFDAAAGLLSPLTQVVPILELEPYCFKFFLPAEIRTALKPYLREDKFPRYTYAWDAESLRELLERRLEYCSDELLLPSREERRSFERLFEPEARTGISQPDMVEEMVQLANGSPRRLIRMAKAILVEHTKNEWEIKPYIAKETYEMIIKEYKKSDT